MKWIILTGFSLFLMSCGLLRSCYSKPGLTESDSENNEVISSKLTENNIESEGVVNRVKSWGEFNQDYLLENEKKSDVQKTASGLQYKVLKEGNGKNPLVHQVVEVHYKGTLIDGKEFDSSYKRNQTASFPLNQVIAGWTEGLQLMKEGATYEFYIPSHLGYGSRNQGSIPADSTLIFQVELIKILN